ncbi:MAG: 4-demethylwyosine synthase TYW1 [Candidatus Aenigmatarchaeota archaeon]
MLEKKGYRFVGKNKHSAVKVCEWTRHAIRGKNFCYKQKFYGIQSHRCIQMSPAVFICNHKCLFCWRSTPFLPKWFGPIDNPSEILDESIEAQRKILQGFWGSAPDKRKVREAMNPNQVAISLVGEPCFYPKLPELVDEVLDRKMTAFVVTNGTIPEMVEKLIEHQPTNMYITLPAPNEKIYKKTCLPAKNYWKNIMKSLSLFKEFDRSVIRLTLVKGLNFINPEEYAKIIDDASPNFVEVKSYMNVGGSRKKLNYSQMPLHSEIKNFAEIIEKNSSYKIKDEKSDSRVVVLSR